jgi:hypothetical protein
MKLKKVIFLIALSIATSVAFGQKVDTKKVETDTIKKVKGNESFKTEIDGQVVTVMISEAGDTIVVAELEDVSVTSMRSFKSTKDRRHYLRMRYHANQVYPYAVEAIRIFREIEATTSDMNSRRRKKHIKRLQKELEDNFKEPLKKLTRTQGRVLIKMIERELEIPMYDLVKDLRGGFTAAYWNTFSKMYDIDLKEGYDPEEDPILEVILSDMNVSHKMTTE